MYSPCFEKAFKELIGYEGGYTNHPNDLGGETNFGISKKAYPVLDIKNLTVQDAKRIYYNDFWCGVKLDQLTNCAIATELFEQAVNMGNFQAQYNLQKALWYLGYQLVIDGNIGPKTLQIVNFCKYPEELLKLLNHLQLQLYIKIIERDSSQKVFIRGWLKRVRI